MGISRTQHLFLFTGMFRAGEAIKAGVHTRTLYEMRDKGVIERLGRGMYRLADQAPLGSPDLAMVAMKIPKGVICLISALSYSIRTVSRPHGGVGPRTASVPNDHREKHQPPLSDV